MRNYTNSHAYYIPIPLMITSLTFFDSSDIFINETH